MAYEQYKGVTAQQALAMPLFLLQASHRRLEEAIACQKNLEDELTQREAECANVALMEAELARLEGIVHQVDVQHMSNCSCLYDDSANKSN